MNITQTIITKKGKKETSNGVYEVEFTTINEQLSQVQVNVLSKNEWEENALPVGSFFHQGETVTCTLPSESTLTPFVKDYENIMESIKRETDDDDLEIL